MAVTHTTTLRTAIAEAVRSAANTGGTPTLTILTSGDALLVTISLAAFGAAASGSTTSASSGNNGTAGATGTANYARINRNDGTEQFRGAVGVGTGEVQISSTSIANGDTVTLTSNVVYTAPT